MIRRPPRSTLFPLHDALPICGFVTALRNLARANLLAKAAILRAQPEAIFIQSESTEYFHAEGPGAEQQAEFYNEKRLDRKSTRLNSSHANISYAVFCLKKKKN